MVTSLSRQAADGRAEIECCNFQMARKKRAKLETMAYLENDFQILETYNNTQGNLKLACTASFHFGKFCEKSRN